MVVDFAIELTKLIGWIFLRELFMLLWKTLAQHFLNLSFSGLVYNIFVLM